ncbi:unnamed protein product [Dibothriocephalus latus]|uniref:Uncharacterized protein n=1 Tax=Dibothriocephalus latus TaxID=60516 RepID=A0A3P7NY45_DIBLA|nr:unnamed protein product [Dibothriocephalus latus]
MDRQQRRGRHSRRPPSLQGLLGFSARLATRWSLFTQLSQLLLANTVTGGQDLPPQDDATSAMEQLRLESFELLEFWSQCMRVADVNVSLLEAVEVECDRLGEELDEIETEATELEACATELRHPKARHQLQVDRLQTIESRLNNLSQTPVGYLDWPELPIKLQTSAVSTPSSVRDACPVPKISSVKGLHSRIASLVDRYQRILPSTDDDEERRVGAITLVDSCETKITDLEAAAISAENLLSVLRRCMNQFSLPSAEQSTHVNVLFLDCALQAQMNLMKELREKHAAVLSCLQEFERPDNYDSLDPSLKPETLERRLEQFIDSFVKFYSDRQMPVEVAHVPILLLRLRELERVVRVGEHENSLHMKASSLGQQSDMLGACGHLQAFVFQLIKVTTRLDTHVEASLGQRRCQQDVETAARAERELHVMLLAMEALSMGQQSGTKEGSPRASLELLSVLLFNDGHIRELLAESSSKTEQETRVTDLYVQLTRASTSGRGEETQQPFADLLAAGGQLLSEIQNLPSSPLWKLPADYIATVAVAVDKISAALEGVRQCQLCINLQYSSTYILHAVTEAEKRVYASVCNYLSNFVTYSVEAQQYPNILQSPTHLIGAFHQSLSSVLFPLDKTPVSEDDTSSMARSDNYLEQFSTLGNFQVLSEFDIYVRDTARVLGTVIELDLAFIHAHLETLETYCQKEGCTSEEFRANFAAAKIALSESQRELERTAASIEELRWQFPDLKLRIFHLHCRLMIPPVLILPPSLNTQKASLRILVGSFD